MSERADLSAVVFDFDGVLVDTERLHYAAFQEVLRPRGMPFDWEEYNQRYMCLGDEDVFRLAYRTAGRDSAPDEIRTLVAEKADAFQTGLAGADVPIFDGVASLLSELREHDMPRAVCSAAGRRDIDLVLGALQLGDSFHAIVSAEDVERGKPDPACYRLAVRRLAERFPDRPLAAASVLAIEDTPGGVAAAQGAGLWVLAVGTTHRAEELTAADLFVERLNQISFPALRRRFAAERR